MDLKDHELGDLPMDLKDHELGDLPMDLKDHELGEGKCRRKLSVNVTSLIQHYEQAISPQRKPVCIYTNN